MEKLEYCAVIRTIGRAGRMYQRLLDSLASQTIPPKKILVYLAEGYDRPTETIGIEQIVQVSKGMVAQRALPYDEVDTEWMLMLDDDIWLDEAPYAIPEDKVMFFKMHLAGLKILTHYNSGFTHLDAATSVTGERAAKNLAPLPPHNRPADFGIHP